MGFGSVWLAARLPLHGGKIKDRHDAGRHEQRPPRIDEIQERVPSLDQSSIIWKRLLKLAAGPVPCAARHHAVPAHPLPYAPRSRPSPARVCNSCARRGALGAIHVAHTLSTHHGWKLTLLGPTLTDRITTQTQWTAEGREPTTSAKSVRASGTTKLRSRRRGGAATSWSPCCLMGPTTRHDYRSPAPATALRRRLCCIFAVLFGTQSAKYLILWWAVLGSNQWPLPCESSALPLS